jgi:hypothetical protein
MSTDLYATHPLPAWLERGDGYVSASIPGTPEVFERLWCRRISDNAFEVCCIPFFLYDLALGDTVEAKARPDGELLLEARTSHAGRYVYRAYFDGELIDNRDRIVDAVQGLGLLYEWSSERLLAIDAKDASAARRLETLLMPEHTNGALLLETGLTARD